MAFWVRCQIVRSPLNLNADHRIFVGNIWDKRKAGWVVGKAISEKGMKKRNN